MVQQQQIEIEEPCNNLVAQSDYEAALAAIESTFESFQLSHDNASHEHSLDRELIEEIYRTAKTSLLNNVKRIVRPVGDNEYHDYVDQYHVVLDDESDNDDDDASPDQELDPRMEETDEEEEEIDFEELIDRKAWKDAQNLRTRIRKMSSSVQSVRERVLKRSEESVLSSISSQLVDKSVKIVFEDACGNDEKGDASDDKENTSAQGTNSNNNNIALQDSLRDLSNVLKDPKWARLPNRIQSLQNTIETVQKETSKDRVMSQTEIAITSKAKTVIDESRRRMLEDEFDQNENVPNFSTENAIDRLALFGQMFS